MRNRPSRWCGAGRPPDSGLTASDGPTGTQAFAGCLPARAREWSEAGRTAFQVTVVACPVPSVADTLARGLTQQSRIARVSSVLFEGQPLAELRAPSIRFHLWTGGAILYQTTAACPDEASDCSDRLDRWTQSLIDHVQPLGDEPPQLGTTWAWAAVAFVLVVWLGVMVVTYLRAEGRKQRAPALNQPPAIVEDFSDVFRMMTLVVGARRAAWGLVVIGISARLAKWGPELLWWVVVGLGVLVLGVLRAFGNLKATGTYRPLEGSSRKAVLGRGLVKATQRTLWLVLLLAVVSIFTSFTMASRTQIVVQTVAVMRRPVGVGLVPLAASLLEAANWRGTILLIALLIAWLPVLARLHRSGQRSAAASSDEVEASGAEGRKGDFFLLLRSFDEDRATVRADVLEPGLLPRWLVPPPARPFEEVVAHALSTQAPVYAISPPGVRLPALGAAKISLDDDQWRDQITQWARDALAIVVFATPGKISEEGFGWELDLVSQALGHRRIMLVFGPWESEDTRTRWRRFRETAAKLPAFAELAELDQPGLRIAARSTASGWKVFACRPTSDLSYMLPIRLTMGIFGTWWAGEQIGDLTAMTEPPPLLEAYRSIVDRG